MLSNLAFSLVLITSGTVEYTAHYKDLKACEAQVQRLRPQLDGTGVIVACMPMNSVTHQDINQQLDAMMDMMRRMREGMEQNFPDQK